MVAAYSIGDRCMCGGGPKRRWSRLFSRKLTGDSETEEYNIVQERKLMEYYPRGRSSPPLFSRGAPRGASLALATCHTLCNGCYLG